MVACNENKFYLANGKLDLSSLNEDIGKSELIGAKRQIKQIGPQIGDQELVELQSSNITATLEEMALMFEEEPKVDQTGLEDEYAKAFSPERLKEEMKEFGIDK